MIVSASRRTDIPAFFADWFFRRMAEGYALTRNPYRPEQIIRIDLRRPSGIVFWTKNPEPMLERLHELGDIPFYFQFTLTSYAADIERHLPTKQGTLFGVFERLAKLIGPERIIWRYDPVFLHGRYDMDWHKRYFGVIAERLSGMSQKCVFSYIDPYDNSAVGFPKLRAPNEEEMRVLGQVFLKYGEKYGFSLATCAESIDLPGIGKSACVDAELLSRIAGRKIAGGKDGAQRKACGCAKSKDIGKYGTCRNGCIYCYAAKGRPETYDPASPFLLDHLLPGEVVPEEKDDRLLLPGMEKL